MSRNTRNVVVIGAGVIGVSTATVFARAGHTVTVVESADRPATGVTSLGSGGFRHQFPYLEETQFAAATLAGWRMLERDYSTSLGLRHVGYLTLATGAVTTDHLEQRAANLRAVGVEHRVLDGAGLRDLVPGLCGDDLTAGLYTPDDGYTSPPAVVAELARLMASRGVTFRFGERVVEVLSAGGAVTGVRLEGSETIPADLVINAAGLRAPEVGALVGDTLPVVAWRQHQFRTYDLPGGGPEDFTSIADNGESLYFRPDGAGALVGYHDDAEAWAEDYTPTRDLADRCLEALDRRWPELAAAGLQRHWVGCYEVTPDWRALIGLSPALAGSAYICGFSGHGLMNSLGAAEDLLRLVEGQPTVTDLGAFDAGRFATA